jgi:hypothetical protein
MNRILFASLLFLPIVGCATILDFHDATEMPLTTSQADPSSPPSSSSSGEAGAQHVEEEEASTSTTSSSSSGGEEQKDAGPSCACVVTPPEGWIGPVALYEGPSNIAPPACGGRYSIAVHTGSKDVSAPDATCGCSCGAPTGASCGTPQVTFFRDKTCTAVSACTGATSLPSGTCTRSTPPSGSSCNDGDVRGFAISAAPATGGSCTPIATTDVQPAQYGNVARLCGLPTDADGGVAIEPAEKAACGGGTICAPPPNTPFASNNHCVVRTGSWMCPAGYPAKRTVYDETKGTDTRSCSACTCGAANGSCAVDLNTFTGNNLCTSAPSLTTTPATCSQFTTQTRFISTAPQYSGSCAPSGGAPVGSFVPADPTTVCCEQ